MGYYGIWGESIPRDMWKLLTDGHKSTVSYAGTYKVSTCWVGIDLEPGQGHPEPLIYETLVIAEPEEIDVLPPWVPQQLRSATRQDADMDHAFMLKMLTRFVDAQRPFSLLPLYTFSPRYTFGPPTGPLS